jgi:hypothetical protein
MKIDIVGFLKIFAQSIGISTSSSSRTKEETQRRPESLKQKDVARQEQPKDNKAQ